MNTTFPNSLKKLHVIGIILISQLVYIASANAHQSELPSYTLIADDTTHAWDISFPSTNSTANARAAIAPKGQVTAETHDYIAEQGEHRGELFTTSGILKWTSFIDRELSVFVLNLYGDDGEAGNRPQVESLKDAESEPNKISYAYTELGEDFQIVFIAGGDDAEERVKQASDIGYGRLRIRNIQYRQLLKKPAPEWPYLASWEHTTTNEDMQYIFNAGQAKLTIYQKADESAGQFKTVAKWRHSVGIMQTNPLDVDDYIQEVKYNNGYHGYYGTFFQKEGDQSLFGATLINKENVWYFELSGDAISVKAETIALRKLISQIAEHQ